MWVPRSTLAKMTTHHGATDDAERILKTLWSDATGEVPLPVDPIRIARRLGIDVIEARLDPSVSAALVKERGQDPTIVLSAADSPNRKRFSCAHEIGHFLRRSTSPDEYEYVDRRDLLASSGTDPEEMYANSFAAALLMPEAEVRRFHREELADYQMAVRFAVSQDAMHYRLVNLKPDR